MYALVIDGTIKSVGSLPRAARRLDTQEWVLPPNGVWTTPQAEACGYFYVVPATKPADTETETWVKSVELVSDTPTEVWTSRPWTADELKSKQVAVLQREQAAAQAALTPTETNALLGLTAPANGGPWRQPSGATDSYPLDAEVLHNEKIWQSLVTANVWEPGVANWLEIGVEWPDWVQPSGAQDAYPVGAKVTHNTFRWISNTEANVWEPGVFGWDQV